jgi:hypothetical protein
MARRETSKCLQDSITDGDRRHNVGPYSTGRLLVIYESRPSIGPSNRIGAGIKGMHGKRLEEKRNFRTSAGSRSTSSKSRIDESNAIDDGMVLAFGEE